MRETLGVQLWGQVLRHLPPADLRSARQAARILDQASREHTEHFEIITLRSSNAGGARGGPDWARVPRLRRLQLIGWPPHRDETLRALFARGGAGLASLREVESGIKAFVDATSWAAILKHAPAVTSIDIGLCYAMDSDTCLAVLATIGEMAPQLCRLDNRMPHSSAQHASIIARTMPNLRSLTACTLEGGTSDEEASLWEALPCSRLTSLVFADNPVVPRRVWESIHRPQLRQLCGVCLPGEGAVALARGLPSLEVLDAAPKGQWAGAEHGVFERVRQARLVECCESFTAHVRICSLLPSLERLTLRERCNTISTDLARATRRTHLVLGWQYGTLQALQPCAWAAPYTMSCLRHLALDVTAAEVPQLALLPAALEVLHVNVDEASNDEIEQASLPEVVDMEDLYDVCAVFEAAARLPRLRTLFVRALGGEVHHGSLTRLVGARLGAVEELEVECYEVRLHDVALLAALRGLRRLHSCELEESASPDEWAKLVAQHASRGLQIGKDVGGSETMFSRAGCPISLTLYALCQSIHPPSDVC